MMKGMMPADDVMIELIVAEVQHSEGGERNNVSSQN